MVNKNKKIKIYISFTREFMWNQKETIVNFIGNLNDIQILNYDNLGNINQRKKDQVRDNINECDMFIAICAFDSGKGYVRQNVHYAFDEYEIALDRNKERKCYLYDNKAFEQSKERENINIVNTQGVFTNNESEIENIARYCFPKVVAKDIKGIFSSIDDIISKIKVDFNCFPAYEYREVLRDKALSSFYQSTNQTLVKLTSFNNNLAYTNVQSPLKSIYDKFMLDEVWLSSIDNILKIVIKKVNGFQISGSYSFINQIVAKLEDVRNREVINMKCTAYYNTVEIKVLNTIISCIDDIDEIINSANKNKSRSLNQERHILNLLRNAESIIKTLSYGKCFLVIGGCGAGKSYFIQSLMQKMLSQSELNERSQENHIYLYLKCPSEYISLRDYILEYSKKVFGVANESSYQFHELLKVIINDEDNTIHKKIVLIIDDFHNWININSNYIKEICELITEYSNIKQLRWILTINDQAYDKVSSKLFFWSKYSSNYAILNDYDYFEELIVKNLADKKNKDSLRLDNWYIKGWVVLDQLNINNRLGLKMLYSNLDNQFRQPTLLIENNPTSMQILCNPFIANILIELKDELSLETIIDLVYIDFIKKYWDRQQINLYNEISETCKIRKEMSISDQEIKIVLEHSLRDIAEFYVRFTEDKCEFNNVKEFIMSKAYKNKEDYAQAYEIILDSFDKAGMLKKVITVDDFDGPRIYIELSFKIFWAYYISLEFIKNKHSTLDYDEAIVKQLEQYLDSININNMSNDIFQFYLLNIQLYVIKKGKSQDYIKNFMQYIFKSKALPKDVILYAGGKSGECMQKCLVEFLKDVKLEEELVSAFPLIYFLIESRQEIMPIYFRIKLLQVHYVSMHDKNLQYYFLYSIKKLFAMQNDYNELVKSMKYFENCEVLEVTEELADITINTLQGVVKKNNQSFINLIINYLQHNHEQAKPKIKAVIGEVETKGALFYYIEWVVKIFCECIISRLGIGSYNFFKTNSWYRGVEINIGKEIALLMKKQANLQLGYWYQQTVSPYEKDSYIELLKKLIKSPDAKDCENAVYLIRHSRATHKQRAIEVDPKFHPLLETLRRDDRIASTVEKNIELFNINIGFKYPQKHNKEQTSTKSHSNSNGFKKVRK